MHLRTLFPAIAFIALGVAALVLLSRVDARVDRAEAAIRNLIQMQKRAYFEIDGHIYYQQPGETREAWNERVKVLVDQGQSPDTYLCDTLHRCDVPGGDVTVCTPCNNNPPSPQCIANHAADMAAACATFECEDCP